MISVCIRQYQNCEVDGGELQFRILNNWKLDINMMFLKLVNHS